MNTGYIIVLVILLLILWAMIEQELLVTTSYTVQSGKLPKEFDNTRFVVLADLHNITFGKNNRRLVGKIEQLSPEFIVIAGDIIDKNIPSYSSNAFKLLEQLAKRYKIFYAYGNHEQKLELYSSGEWPKECQRLYDSWVLFKDRLKELQVEFLDNSDTVWRKNNSEIHITGVSIDKKFFERTNIPAMEEDYIPSLIGQCDTSQFQLLIAHNPVYFNDYAAWGADLTISGHLHGGLVRLPGVGGVISPQVKLFPKYHSGNYTRKGQLMVVSRGLGTHSHMPRLFNIPELILIELKATKGVT